MPEFRLDHGSQRQRFGELDSFTQGYVEAAFWLLDEELGERSLDELSDEAWNEAEEDCRAFQESCAELLTAAYATRPDYSERSAGLDFYLTRCGHGAGFWDRGLGEIGERLSGMARPYGESSLYLGDDEKLYLA
jgi:hypothetical protein